MYGHIFRVHPTLLLTYSSMPPPPSETGVTRISYFPISAIRNGRWAELFLITVVITLCLSLIKYNVSKKRRKRQTDTEQFEVKDIFRITHSGKQKELSHPHTRLLQEQPPPPPLPFTPIYPWLTPPQPLPIPHGAETFPLPTLRRHSSAQTSQHQPTSESRIVSYTRRVSTNSIPARTSVLHGTVTTSQKGWRRRQWVVTGG
ncbi:uncharacterized protein EI97DRAFT_106511 [Westerdykella ornata]|uniref:Uncharacterized protein n=1 Tax=Westerdykella ornata TaxID=318751 RepID=A0A6A6JUT0_WESOR|nr:uncharacterized protein EI97DRAFT_106511 [Westerdykella ornata]KAF2279974.1 hypothetical protein EI97DRAFT_106511 [Westerdykella ornata]